MTATCQFPDCRAPATHINDWDPTHSFACGTIQCQLCGEVLERAECCGTPEAIAVTPPASSTVPACVTKDHLVQCSVARGRRAVQNYTPGQHFIHRELQDILAFVWRTAEGDITLTCAQCNIKLESQGAFAHLTCPSCSTLVCQLCNCRLLHLVQLPAIKVRASPRVGRLHRYMPSSDQDSDDTGSGANNNNNNASSADNTHAQTVARAGFAWVSQHFGDVMSTSSGRLFSSASEMYGKVACYPVLRTLCQRIPALFPPLDYSKDVDMSDSDGDVCFSDGDGDGDGDIDSDSEADEGRARAMSAAAPAANTAHPALVYRQLAALGRILFEVPLPVMDRLFDLDASLFQQLLIPNWPLVDVDVLVVAAAIHNVVQLKWRTDKPAEVLARRCAPTPWWSRRPARQVNVSDAGLRGALMCDGPVTLLASPVFGHWLTDILRAGAPGAAMRNPAANTGAAASASPTASAYFLGSNSYTIAEYQDMTAYRMQANFDPMVPAMPFQDMVLDETGTDFSVSSDTEDEQQAQSVDETLDTWSTTSGSTSRSHGSHRHSAPRSAA